MTQKVNVDVLIEGMNEQAKAISELNTEIETLHDKVIDDLVKCKCGIPSHEYKVKKLIDKWIQKRVNL